MLFQLIVFEGEGKNLDIEGALIFDTLTMGYVLSEFVLINELFLVFDSDLNGVCVVLEDLGVDVADIVRYADQGLQLLFY
ncbi:MAG: hypothetical protein EZS28_012579 [Streblomastix strix]|uniref:Uncharacterized protein n=1 Tax=Streblomastix strix TaxID=222440 RepID=A0A5J4WB51_9EUKA|nr:MAG: hypothetical protein EZS28_012579 [Streblomastix strix]